MMDKAFILIDILLIVLFKSALDMLHCDSHSVGFITSCLVCVGNGSNESMTQIEVNLTTWSWVFQGFWHLYCKLVEFVCLLNTTNCSPKSWLRFQSMAYPLPWLLLGGSASRFKCSDSLLPSSEFSSKPRWAHPCIQNTHQTPMPLTFQRDCFSSTIIPLSFWSFKFVLRLQLNENLEMMLHVRLHKDEMASSSSNRGVLAVIRHNIIPRCWCEQASNELKSFFVGLCLGLFLSFSLNGAHLPMVPISGVYNWAQVGRIVVLHLQPHVNGSLSPGGRHEQSTIERTTNNPDVHSCCSFSFSNLDSTPLALVGASTHCHCYCSSKTTRRKKELTNPTIEAPNIMIGVCIGYSLCFFWGFFVGFLLSSLSLSRSSASSLAFVFFCFSFVILSLLAD